jgi:hypothetical protein
MTKQKEQDNRKLDTRKNLLKRLIQVIMQIVLFAGIIGTDTYLFEIIK